MKELIINAIAFFLCVIGVAIVGCAGQKYIDFDGGVIPDSTLMVGK